MLLRELRKILWLFFGFPDNCPTIKIAEQKSRYKITSIIDKTSIKDKSKLTIFKIRLRKTLVFLKSPLSNFDNYCCKARLIHQKIYRKHKTITALNGKQRFKPTAVLSTKSYPSHIQRANDSIAQTT